MLRFTLTSVAVACGGQARRWRALFEGSSDCLAVLGLGLWQSAAVNEDGPTYHERRSSAHLSSVWIADY
jgi:hypothetical protein